MESQAVQCKWPPVYDATYRPATEERYWARELEVMDPEARQALILAKLQAQIAYCWEHAPLYQEKWKAAGLEPGDIQTLEDFHRMPVVTKAEIRKDQATHPPFGSYLCIPREAVFRIHGTSGTTGKPTGYGIGEGDWRRIAEAHARVLWGMGFRPGDTLFIASVFSLYIGSWGALLGAERLGMTAFPFGAGAPGQTRLAARWIADIRPSGFYGTPSYALYLAEVARQEGFDPRTDFTFTRMFFSGEPGAGIPGTRRKIEAAFGARCFDSGSTGEMTPWMTNGECEAQTGMHLWQDIVFTELCHPETRAVVPFGAEGVPVYTHLERTSQPMIRFWSGDLATWTDAPCPCGRTYPRLSKGIYGRVDDMFIVRGENVYPSAIEEVLRSIPGCGEEYRIVITREEAMDELCVQVEMDPNLKPGLTGTDPLPALTRQIADRMRTTLGIRTVIALMPPGSLERTQFKARRVIDNRDLFKELREKG